MNVFLLMVFLWRQLPLGDGKDVFEKQLLKGVWRFAAGMSGIQAISAILTQIDKIILSKMLSLEMFGYYTLASMLGMSLLRFVTPVFFSIYPRFTQLVAIGGQEELKRLYHKSCQFMAVLVLPAAIIVALFSHEILLIWTRNPVTAEKTHLLLSMLILGTAFNGLLYPPYALQLSFGWTSLPILKSVVAVILLVPSIVFMAHHYGATGAASAWLALNAGYILFEIPIMHRRLLRTEKWRWYWHDVCFPLAACVLTGGLGRLLMSSSMSQFAMSVYLIVISVLTLGITGAVTSVTRAWFFERFSKMSWADASIIDL
jgi:O-antigen/teichoic acid export membrane protein